MDLLRNATSNAEYKGLDCDRLKINHVQVNKAPVTRRRTYRAHGVINSYVRHPCRMQIVLEEQEEQ